MPRTRKSVLDALKATQPNAPYAIPPSRFELLEAVRRFAIAPQGDASGSYGAANLVHRQALFTAWDARVNALRTALTSHYTTGAGNRAIACHCHLCEQWRPEIERLYADKKAKHDKDD